MMMISNFKISFSILPNNFKCIEILNTRKLPELNKEFITETDFKFFKQKKLEEMKERIDDGIKK